MYSKENQTGGDQLIPGTNLDVAKAQQYLAPVERPVLSTWLPKITHRKYQGQQALIEAKRLELALANAELVPEQHREGLYLYAVRQGGTRIGAKYNLVPIHELAKTVMQLIPSMCMYLGVPFDEAYFAMAMGIAHHLRNHHQALTMEELAEFPHQVFIIPIEAIPEPYQVFDMKAMAEVMREYERHIYSKQAGPAHGWLRDNMKTEEELAAIDRAKAWQGIDPRYVRSEEALEKYPADIAKRLAAAFTRYLEQGVSNSLPSPYEPARTACATDGTLLAQYVCECLLTISKAVQGQAAHFAWQMAMAQSARGNKQRQARITAALESEGKEVPLEELLAPADIAFIQRLTDMHLLAFQFREWHRKGFTTPPEVVQKPN